MPIICIQSIFIGFFLLTLKAYSTHLNIFSDKSICNIKVIHFQTIATEQIPQQIGRSKLGRQFNSLCTSLLIYHILMVPFLYTNEQTCQLRNGLLLYLILRVFYLCHRVYLLTQTSDLTRLMNTPNFSQNRKPLHYVPTDFRDEKTLKLH